MSVDICFYIQKHNIEKDRWENVELFKDRYGQNPVEITYVGGTVWDLLREQFGSHISDVDYNKICIDKGWVDLQELIHEGNTHNIPCYCTSLSYLKYLATDDNRYVNDDYLTEDEIREELEFWVELYNDINNFLKFTDCRFDHPDNIRIVALISY